MRKPRARTPGRTYTISATDEEWAAIGAGAERAGQPRAVWAVECALTVDPLPGRSRRLVLDGKQQRSMSRGTEALARSLCADFEAPSELADDLRALLAARLGGMVRRGRGEEAVARLRETFGVERADIVIAAMMPETGMAVEPADEPAAKKPTAGKPAPRSSSRTGRARGSGWLVDTLWGEQAVGIVGGEPKCGKSILAMDLAVAVAAGVPCLRHFAPARPGPVLMFPTEDAGHLVRKRLHGIARAAGARFETLDIAVIDVPTLRLDDADDRGRLRHTVL